jgi:N-acylneuraminate cytidylyltransferase
LALIPARGGSKGIPGKNLQPVGGIPLVCRTIRAALNAESVGRAVVSTDDPAIGDAAREAGAGVVARPDHLAGDAASSESALLHSLEQLALEGPLPAVFVFLQCTSPFTTGAQIDRVVHGLQASEANMAFAVTPWHGFLWSRDAAGWAIGVNHDASRPRQRRQDLDPCYLETGAIYALRTAAFLEARNRFVPPLLPVAIEAPAPEIDTPHDLDLCRQLAGLLDPSEGAGGMG